MSDPVQRLVFRGQAHPDEILADLRPALDAALSSDRPTLIIIPIDYRENALLSQRLGEIACPI